jgi:ferredoxin--NADP+ reductase
MIDRPLRVAVVGSGPSGIYAADALTAQDETPVSVDVIDRLPAPFGLVRYGVAPDHVSIRSVRATLEKVLDRPAVRYLGNVEVGRDLSLDDMHRYYDAVVFSYGASRDRALGIPGEDLPGSVAATDLVAWYTGHPEAPRAEMEDAVSHASSAVVVGVGNVAVDVVRVLAKAPAELEGTDMPQHVLDLLASDDITDIHLLGRRGPAQGAFTTKELRELGELEDADVLVSPDDLALDPASERTIAENRLAARNVDVIRGLSQREAAGRRRRIHVHFFTRPVEIRGDDRVAEVVVERTELDEDGRARGTGATSVIPAQLVVRSVGYRGTPIPGLPFDEDRNVIPSEDGRMMRDGSPVPGGYVAGWIKRGPTGIIGTNKKDAAATVVSLLADAAAGRLAEAPEPQPAAVNAALADRGVTVVTVEGWHNIDAAEIALGASRGRDRTTLHEVADLLAAAAPTAPSEPA